jgi:hypothetical protein
MISRSEQTWKKLTIQEINDLWNKRPNLVLDEIVRADKAGALFLFGVDKIKDIYRLTIDGSSRGIYLRPDTEDVSQRRHWRLRSLVAILPDADQKGTVDWRGKMDVLFYVSPKKFTCLCQDAEQVFKEYFFEGACFRMIPDIWFSDTALVQFIREQLRPHPAMRPWFFEPKLFKDNRLLWSPKFYE